MCKLNQLTHSILLEVEIVRSLSFTWITPYFNSDCGHYNGYSVEDFENLLKLLSSIKGKFLLSSYPSPILQKYAKENGWFMWSVEQGVTINNKSGYIKRKTECITANFKFN